MPVDHYENFPVASFWCLAALRRPIEVIYRFARGADDIAGRRRRPADQRRPTPLPGGADRIAAGTAGANPCSSPNWPRPSPAMPCPSGCSPISDAFARDGQEALR